MDSYAIERGLADRHALEVTDTLHKRVMVLVAACAQNRLSPPPDCDPAKLIEAARARGMLDVSYAGSPVVGPSAGDRFSDRNRLHGTTRHLLMSGARCPEVLRLRWAGLVAVIDAESAAFEASRAGVPDGGAVLVQPDGFVAFRAAPANAAGMTALENFLAGYLIPAG